MITIIKEIYSELLFTVRNYNSTATYSVYLNRVGYVEATSIVLNNPVIYSGRALKFTTNLKDYSEATYNYILKENNIEVDSGTFYFLNLNTNNDNIYL